MTFWVNDELELIDAVSEPSRPGVVTFLSNSMDTLIPFMRFCPEPPFRPTGGGFKFGVHVPISELKGRYARFLTSERAESLEWDVSAEPNMFHWIGRRPVVDVDVSELEGSYFQDGDDWYQTESGYVWPDNPKEIFEALKHDGFEEIALVPCYSAHYALQLEYTFSGQIESFVPVVPDEEEGQDEPPNFRDLFGGGA